MSKIALQGDASGTGTFTIASPNSNSNYTLTLPSSTGTVVVTGGAQTIEFAAGTAASPSITFTGDTNTGIFSPAADTIAFAEGGAEAMRIDSSGNVGIGVTPSAWDAGWKVLQISEGVFVNSDSQPSLTDVGSNFYVSGGADKYIVTDEASKYRQYNGEHIWFTAPSGTAGNNITFTERMRIDSSGNVGIGTSSPSNKFVVSGNISGGTSPVTAVFNQKQGWNASEYEAMQTGISQFRSVYTGGSNWDLSFLTYNGSFNERARITSAGYLLVGTTSNASNGMVAISYARGTTAGMRIQDTVGSGGNGVIADFYNSSGTSVGSITHNSSNTTYGTSSDYRLKENVQPMTGALERVAALKPCTYRWKETGIDGEGFIAHELQAVVPDAVVGEKDAVNEDGSIKPQSIDTSFLVATLTAAIQELKAITDAQATRIEALEAEVAALKGQ